MDERFGIIGGKLQRRNRLAAARRKLPNRFSCAFDAETESDAGFIEKVLRLIVAGPREISNAIEAEIPSLMQMRILGKLPDSIDAAMNTYLDIDAGWNAALIFHEISLPLRLRDDSVRT